MFDALPLEVPGADPLDAASTVLAAVRGEDYQGWTGAAIGERVTRLAELKAHVDAALALTAGEFEATGDWA